MARTLIIGYGNTLRGDDGLGWRAAEQQVASQSGGDIEVQMHHQLAPELAQTMSEAGRVIFLDACCDGPPGQIRCRRVEPSGEPSGFTHHVNPSVLLAMAKHLFGHCPETFIISVAGESFECGEILSPHVERALPEVQKLIAGLMEGQEPAGQCAPGA